MRSIAPKDYDSLPRLAAPAGYICVIRDIYSDAYRIEGTAQPRQHIQNALNETESKFGIELLSILAAEDLAATEAELYELYHARLSRDWLDLDPYQLQALRQSILQIDAHASQYLTPQRPACAKQAARPKPVSGHERLTNSYHRRTNEAEGFRRAYSRPSAGPNRNQWKRPRTRAPLPERRYGPRSLRRNQTPAGNQGEVRLSMSDRASDLFEDALVNHPGKVIAAVLLVMIIGLAWLSQHNYQHYPMRF